MTTNIAISDSKKALLAHKEKLLRELDYYDSRIEEIISSRPIKSSFIDDSDGSDSDSGFLSNVDFGPSLPQLKKQQSSLKTCLQATQELTSLQVLQSQVNVLVADPNIEGEPPVPESGVWREVNAECRVDLVPFSIDFYVHKPERQFGPLRYRGVRTVAVRAAHAAELDASIMRAVSTPGDAVEVMKNYACAHRSRRTTLARLAAKYGDKLHMEPMPEGGYLLKCVNLLEVTWVLQNKWSPIAPFHHRMKFNLEYMDESYIKIITQAHRQLSDPLIETDERTSLLSKIISTCLEAQGPTQELYESMSSDPETAQSLRKRRTTLDQEPEHPIVSKNKDKEVMAPPKSLPKKAKPKGKENVIENRKTKRTTEDNVKAKKAKVTEVVDVMKFVHNNVDNEDVEQIFTNKDNSVKETDKIGNNNKDSTTKVAKPQNAKVHKNKEVKVTKENNSDKIKKNIGDIIESNKNIVKKKLENMNNDEARDVGDKVKKNPCDHKKDVNKPKDKLNAKKSVTNEKNEKSTKQAKEKAEKVVPTTLKTQIVKKSEKTVNTKVVKNKDTVELTQKNEKKKEKEEEKEGEKEKVKTVKSKVTKDNNANKDKPKSVPPKTTVKVTDTNKIAKDTVKSAVTTNNNSKQVVKNKQVDNAITEPVTAKKDKPTKIVEDILSKNKNENKNKDKESNTVEELVEKKSTNFKRKSNLADKDADKNVAITKKPKLFKPDSVQKATNKENKISKPQNVKTSNMIKKVEQNKPKFITNSMKTLKTGNIQRVFNSGNISKQSSDKPSRIPQKKLSTSSEATLKKNPFRVSPRKIPSKFKNPAAPFGTKYTAVQKTTSIPRLMKKPSPKT